MKFKCNLLVLLVLLFYISGAVVANEINCGQKDGVMRAKRQTAEQYTLQQHQQPQR